MTANRVAVYNTTGHCTHHSGAENRPDRATARRWFDSGLIVGAWEHQTVTVLRTKAHSRARLDRRYIWYDDRSEATFETATEAVLQTDCEFDIVTDSGIEAAAYDAVVSGNRTPGISPDEWATIDQMDLSEPLQFVANDIQTAVGILNYAIEESAATTATVRKPGPTMRIDAEIDVIVDENATGVRLESESARRVEAAYEQFEAQIVDEAVDDVREAVATLQAETRLTDAEVRDRLQGPLPATDVAQTTPVDEDMEVSDTSSLGASSALSWTVAMCGFAVALAGFAALGLVRGVHRVGFDGLAAIPVTEVASGVAAVAVVVCFTMLATYHLTR